MSFITDLIGTYLLITSAILGYLWHISPSSDKDVIGSYIVIVWLLWCLYLETVGGILLGVIFTQLSRAYYQQYLTGANT